MITDIAPSHSAGTESPSFRMPANACDCHMHVFDAGLPFAKNAMLTHGSATPEQYQALQRRLGTSRNVVVQPSSYGADHRALLSALQKFGDTSRGVAVVTPDTEEAILEELASSNVVGARMNLVQYGATDLAMARPLAPRLRRLGWHLQVHMLPEAFLTHLDLLLSLGVDVVVDHFARVCSDEALVPLVERGVHKLLASGRGWLKLSGAYMAVPDGSSELSRLDDFVCSLVQRHPDRLVWGTDWPHVTEAIKPNDAQLANLLLKWIPDEDVRDAVLTSNPARLYQFTAQR
ncbi:amidohydrolase family protein [Cupriavidus oxalaticus]|uniref:amidohydrolase family protein n=1 Tax=Cupriavidus oxalaticus TaxID=96344 RepID=UPI004033E106